MTIIPVIGLIMVIFFSTPKKDATTSTEPPVQSKAALTSQLNTPFTTSKNKPVLFAHVEEKIHEVVPPKIIPPKKAVPAPEAPKPTPPAEPRGPITASIPTSIDTGDYEAILTYITTKYPKTPPSDAEEIATNLVAYGKDHQVDPKLIAALIARESGFNKTAISKSGAIGLGQIKSLNFNHLKIDDPFDIKENVQGTVKYMSLLMNVWKDKSENVQWALASYYKGPTAIRKSEGKIDEQTKSYVSDILKYYDSISQMKNSIISKAP